MMNMNLAKIMDQSESILMCEEKEEAGDRFRTITKSKKKGFSIGGLVSGKRRALPPPAPKQPRVRTQNTLVALDHPSLERFLAALLEPVALPSDQAGYPNQTVDEFDAELSTLQLKTDLKKTQHNR